ncbi:MAG TPA: VWA domain-containing protein, partial [Vicinamibacteria bacterium]|nr:VWA domain-containing protein [Vicinamibacteria bacterium]
AITDFEAMRIYLYQDSQVAGRVSRRFETYGSTSRVESQQDQQRRQYLPGVNDPYVERRAAEEYLKLRTRNRVTLGSIERALRPLTASKERKTLLLVSNGFVNDLEEEGFKRITEAARRANAVIYFLDTRGLEVSSLYSAQFGAMPGEPSDVGAILADTSQDAAGAEALALDTGGFVVRNTNDLTSGVDRIAQESRAYYLLGYSPSVPRDGRFRKLDVKVRGKGQSVRARRGYYAPLDGKTVAPRAAAEAKDTEFQQALDGAAFLDGIPLRMTAHVLESQGLGKVRVLVAADIDVARMTFEEKEGQSLGALDLLLVVAQRETGEFSRYDQKIDLAKKPGAVAAGPSWYAVVRDFDLVPGGYQAKIVVREPATQKLGSLAFDFEVPAIDRFRVSTPILTDTLQQSGGGLAPVLVARRSFPASRPLYCRFDVFGMAKGKDGVVKVSAGHVLRKADGTVLGRNDPTPILPTSLGGVSRLMQVPLNLDPGDYELVLTVRDDIAGVSQELVEPFAVVAP